MEANRTVVIGIDGAHFELIESWVANGHLPNIEEIFERGITSDLHSVLPPVTSPNWKAYTTGKNPGKIGIFWWENVDINKGEVYYPSNRKHYNTEIWEYLSEDTTVGVLGVPTTYPPKEVNGFLVSGAPDAENTGFAYPEELSERLSDDGYKVRKSHQLKSESKKAEEEILDLIDSRFETANELADEYDVSFLQVTTFYINSLHHFFWDDEITREAWEKIDSHIGDLVKPSDNVILMSDHGSNEVKTVFHVNSWLEREGYLETNLGTAKLLYQIGLTTNRLDRLTTKLHVNELARKLAPAWLKGILTDEHGDVNQEGKTTTINWGNSEAVASGQGPIYVKKPETVNEIQEKLQSLEGPEGPIAENVFLGSDIYSGEFADEGPELLVDQARGVHITGGIGRNNVFSRPEEEGWRGENKKYGLFAAAGPDFNTENINGKISILDLAPTLLHLFGHPVPEGMDGRVVKSVFDDKSEAATRNIRSSVENRREKEIKRIRQAAREIYDI